MPLLDCIQIFLMIHPCGAYQKTFILYFRESSPYKENRVTMYGSTFFVCPLLH